MSTPPPTNTNTTTSPSSTSSMKIPISSSRAHDLSTALSSVQTRISHAAAAAALSSSSPPRLVAVSKLKPASDILALHSAPTSHLHFGENYVQELLEKSRLLPRSVRWHFIGGLQSNKCAQLAREVPNLWAVESVDSVKKARLLEKGRGEGKDQEVDGEGQGKGGEGGEGREKLRVFVQVNTSGEESKSGVEPKSKELVDLCTLIHGSECPNLHLQGLMTIGAIARSKETTPETANEDFESLRENRDWVAKEIGVEASELELSMGMSEDFEGAIAQGSDEVRVGSTIFGVRPPKSEAKVLEHTEEEKK